MIAHVCAMFAHAVCLRRCQASLVERLGLLRVLWLALFVCLLALLDASASLAAIPNTLYRIDIRPRKDLTRISISLENPAQYKISSLPGNRLRITLEDTEGTLFRKYRKYADSNIGGLVVSRRGGQLLVTFQVAGGAGWRDITSESVRAVTVEVGRGVPQSRAGYMQPGREKIWSGIEKLVRDFDPPLKSDIIFMPTDRQILKSLLDEEGVQAFSAGEAALYKGQLSDAEEIFTGFASKNGGIRSLALYRLGETSYKLQKYPQALAAFREAEKLWGEFLNFNPGVSFYYGDSIARSGDLAGGRSMMSGLIGRLADKKYAPVLLVRLADILARQGHDKEAMAVYLTVAENFKDNKANQMARLRLADREFMSTAPWSYVPLAERYQEIASQSSDIDLREESRFKYVLLESIHGEAGGALSQLLQFQKKFPRGAYSTVCRTMREVLVGLAYRQGNWDKDPAALVRFVEEHLEYLAGCVEQPAFLTRVKQAYDEAGRPLELVKSFSAMLEKPWSAPGGPFLHEVVAENAELLGDNALAAKNLRSFIQKYPAHPRVRLAWERLGGLYFNDGKMTEARNTLQWLLNKGESAQIAESYYYLGKSLLSARNYAAAVRSMDLYFSRSERAERYQPDAFIVAVSAREAAGDRKGALRLLEAALKLPDNARSDEMLYKAGTIARQEGQTARSREYLEQLAKNSKDPDWQKLARQALDTF